MVGFFDRDPHRPVAILRTARLAVQVCPYGSVPQLVSGLGLLAYRCGIHLLSPLGWKPVAGAAPNLPQILLMCLAACINRISETLMP